MFLHLGSDVSVFKEKSSIFDYKLIKKAGSPKNLSM